MLFPIIKVKDSSDGRIHVVGTSSHDTLYINKDRQICYYNLQNCEGTGDGGAYSFVGFDDGGGRSEIEFVTFEELSKIYEEDQRQNVDNKQYRDKFIKYMRERTRRENQE